MVEDKDEGHHEEEGGARPHKSSKGLLIVIVILVIALAGGAAAYALLFSNRASGPKAAKEEKTEVKTALVPLDSFVLNLAEQGRFLKVTMQFELGDAADEALVKERTPQLRDAVITLVSSKSADVLSSPEGKLQLKDELLLRANQAVGKDIFKNLYFTEFVMQ